MEKCKSCGERRVGEYCYSCGQRYFEYHDFSRVRSYLVSALALEQGLIKTTVDLLTNSKSFFQRYLGGITKIYTNPIAYLAAVMVWVLLVERWSDFNQEIGVSDGTLNLILYVISTLMIFSIAIVQKWFFRSRQLRFLERLIIAIYVVSGTFIFGTLTELLNILGLEITHGDLLLFDDEKWKYYVATFLLPIAYLLGPYYGSSLGSWVKTASVILLALALAFTFLLFIIFVGDALFGEMFFEYFDQIFA